MSGLDFFPPQLEALRIPRGSWPQRVAERCAEVGLIRVHTGLEVAVPSRLDHATTATVNAPRITTPWVVAAWANMKAAKARKYAKISSIVVAICGSFAFSAREVSEAERQASAIHAACVRSTHSLMPPPTRSTPPILPRTPSPGA